MHVHTLPDETTGIVRNLKKTMLYLRLPKTSPGTGAEVYERESTTIPLPPNEDVELYWEDFQKVEHELVDLQRKKFIKIIRWPKNKFEPLVIQKNHTTVVPVTTAINFQDSASTVFTVNPEGMTASIVVTAISAISSAESVMLNAPVDPAWGANINGKVVRYTGAFYTPALADSAVNALAIGIAKNYDVVKGTADIFLFGMVDGLGLTGTELQYLSATNFGMMEPTAPINGVTVPLGTPQGSNFFLNIDLNQNIFVDTFSMTDWFSTDAGDLYSLDFTHGLGIMFPRIAVYDEATKDQVWVDRTRVLDSDTLRISVCQEAVDGRFFGAITIGR